MVPSRANAASGPPAAATMVTNRPLRITQVPAAS